MGVKGLITQVVTLFYFFKSASFAIGNAAYHSDTLYTALSPAVPPLVDLLTDSVARTRANAAGKCQISELKIILVLSYVFGLLCIYFSEQGATSIAWKKRSRDSVRKC